MRRRTTLVVQAVAAVAALSLVLAACGGGGGDKKTQKKAAPKEAVQPLTGLAPAGDSVTRPALEVKMDNTAPARPQSGVDVADVVYEEVVECELTRLLTIFNSALPDQVGPIRSVRATDPNIVWPLGGVFAYSGGAPQNVELIRQAPVNAVDESAAGNAMFRERSRQAPLRLYYSGEVVRYEPVKAGRQNELYQMGLEHLGGDARAADAEVLAIAAECLERLGVRGRSPVEGPDHRRPDHVAFGRRLRLGGGAGRRRTRGSGLAGRHHRVDLRRRCRRRRPGPGGRGRGAPGCRRARSRRGWSRRHRRC